MLCTLRVWDWLRWFPDGVPGLRAATGKPEGGVNVFRRGLNLICGSVGALLRELDLFSVFCRVLGRRGGCLGRDCATMRADEGYPRVGGWIYVHG